MSDDLKVLGSKVRKRLQDELKKRRFIVRLDDSTEGVDTLPLPPVPLPATRKRARTSERSPSQEKTASSTSDKHGSSAAEVKVPASAVVALYGFPLDQTTVGHVRRFLSGLDVLAVYVPLVQLNKEKGDIPVLARLGSPVVANLALARSGEPAVGWEEAKQEIAIRVVSSPNTPQLWVKAKKGVTLQELRQKVKAALHPAVPPLLQHHTQEILEPKRKRKKFLSDSTVHRSRHSTIPGLGKDDLLHCIGHSNDSKSLQDSIQRIQNLMDEIMYQLPFLHLQATDCNLSHLTATALQVLKDQLTVLQRHQVRQFRLLGVPYSRSESKATSNGEVQK